jgi:uncharacterized protein (DUF2164 family)
MIFIQTGSCHHEKGLRKAAASKREKLSSVTAAIPLSQQA